MADYHRPDTTTEDAVISNTSSNTNTTTDTGSDATTVPKTIRRYIYDDTDLQHFLQSPSKDALYKFTAAMGKACATTTTTSNASYELGVSPGIACLIGALHGIKEWVQSDFPPTTDNTIGNRFGNPMFRKWHTQLIHRSTSIITTILKVSNQYSRTTTTHHHDENNGNDDEECDFDIDVVMKAYEAGIQSTRDTDSTSSNSDTTINNDEISDHDRIVISELSLYLQDSFGHPIRLDYGTGHETSFHIFLFLLCQLHVFHNSGYKFQLTNDNDNNNSSNSEISSGTAEENKNKQQQQHLPSIARFKAIILSTYHQYLLVTREVQTQYWLEPAGSHGVWGLDDYHCLPFYFGACQLVEQQDSSNFPSHTPLSSLSCFSPSSIHDEQMLQEFGDIYLYFGCIRYIKLLKKNVPFFESSPMLDDISQIATWKKIASGLLKLYDGEVLSKRQVVQHLVFGTLFPANWTPSHNEDSMLPPSETFRNTPNTTAATSHPRTATSATMNNNIDTAVMTKAPWAK
jgi:hypothetical protein